MNKKGWTKIPWIIIIIIIILSVVLGLVFNYFFTQEFDPDKHVYTEIECDHWTKDKWQQEGRYSFNGSHCVDGWIEGNAYIPLMDEVKDWRDKTKCELDTNDDGCVCDEWKEESCLTEINYYLPPGMNGNIELNVEVDKNDLCFYPQGGVSIFPPPHLWLQYMKM